MLADYPEKPFKFVSGTAKPVADKQPLLNNPEVLRKLLVYPTNSKSEKPTFGGDFDLEGGMQAAFELGDCALTAACR